MSVWGRMSTRKRRRRRTRRRRGQERRTDSGGAGFARAGQRALAGATRDSRDDPPARPNLSGPCSRSFLTPSFHRRRLRSPASCFGARTLPVPYALPALLISFPCPAAARLYQSARPPPLRCRRPPCSPSSSSCPVRPVSPPNPPPLARQGVDRLGLLRPSLPTLVDWPGQSRTTSADWHRPSRSTVIDRLGTSMSNYTC